jgi:PAS domain S-box-containing protein
MGFLKNGKEKQMTEKIEKEKNLNGSFEEFEEKYRKLFEMALDAIFVADADTGIIIDCNNAAEELVGRKRSEIIGQHQRILHPPEETIGDFSKTFKQHLEEKEGQVLEAKVITKEGKIKDVMIKVCIINTEGKKIIQGIFHDITKRKKTEEDLEKLNKELHSRLEELERFNRLAVGRELKMIELKKRIKELEEKQTNQPHAEGIS